MYIVNTSFIVEASAQGRWLDMIRKSYIPLIKSSGFGTPVFCRVISVENVDSLTYSLQVHVKDIQEYRRLTTEIFNEYLTVAEPTFGTDVMWFTTLMKKMDL